MPEFRARFACVASRRIGTTAARVLTLQPMDDDPDDTPDAERLMARGHGFRGELRIVADNPALLAAVDDHGRFVLTLTPMPEGE